MRRGLVTLLPESRCRASHQGDPGCPGEDRARHYRRLSDCKSKRSQDETERQADEGEDQESG